MKKYITLLVAAIALLSIPVLETGCSTPPSARVQQVQTLKAVGHSAEAAVQLTAQMYIGGQITSAQATQVRDFYDNKFQPAFRLAVLAVNSNLDTQAPENLILLSTQLSSLVLQFQHH